MKEFVRFFGAFFIVMDGYCWMDYGLHLAGMSFGRLGMNGGGSGRMERKNPLLPDKDACYKETAVDISAESQR